VVAAGPLVAQAPSSTSKSSNLPDLAARLAAITAVTGYEQAAVDTLLRLLPGARRDRAGNAVLVLGSGEPRRLVVCPLDEPGYVVGNIRRDGYLTLRRVPGAVPALFDQQIEGQRVTVHGRGRLLAGVVAVRSIHLARSRAGDADEPFTAESAFVDIGASSAEEARRVGARVLSPVTLAKRPHRYGRDLLAAPSAGARTSCAALLAAAVDAAADPGAASRVGTVVVAFTVEQRLSGRGIATLSNTLGPFRQSLILSDGSRAPWAGLGEVRWRALAVRYAGTPVETVALGAADSLRQELRQWIVGGRP
jgi:putative aminopeptidase